MFTCTGRSYW